MKKYDGEDFFFLSSCYCYEGLIEKMEKKIHLSNKHKFHRSTK